MQLSIVVVASFAIACCAAAENRKMDEAQYKNHRLSTNDTKASSGHKYPVYPTQMYANLSNVKDFTTVKSAASEKPSNRATEALPPQDVVRMFITPAAEKKRKQDYQPVVTTQGSIASSPRTSSSSAPSAVYLVTAKSAPPAVVKDVKSPVYSRPSPQGNFKETTTTTTTVAEDESRRNIKPRYNNGTKTRRVMKTQNPTAQQQQQSHLLYAVTTPPTMLQVAARDTFAITTKVNSSNASKPFTTVLVPKQMLDGDLADYNARGGDSSFRPIAAPTFVAYKPNVDTNSIAENRRVSSAVVKAPTAPKSAGHVAAKPVAYKVEEFADGQSLIVTGGSYGVNNKQDRSDQTYVPAEKFKQEQAKFNPSRPDASPKYNSAPNHGAPKHDDVPTPGLKYGFTAPETVAYEQQPHRNVHSTDQYHREFYPATEIPPRDVQYRPPYNAEGKYNVRASEMAGPSFESEKSPHKDFTPSRFAPMNPEPESNGPEFVLGDANQKYVLKSILRDMLKSKQQSEAKPSPSTMDEIIDSYFKTSRPNVDFSLDNYDIETGESAIYIYEYMYKLGTYIIVIFYDSA